MAEEAKTEAPKKKGKKGLIIIIAASLLLGGGGGGAWFFMKGKKEDPQAAEAEHRKKEKKSKMFVNLDPFTVNLADEDDRFAQVAVVLEVTNNEVSDEIKTMMPAVRNKILLLLSSKRSRELLTVEGKEALAIQISDATARVIGWQPPPPKKVKVKAKAKAKAKPAKDEEADADAEDEDGAEKTATDEAEAEETPKGKGKEKSAANPVEKVHFAQFIIQ